MDCIENQAAFEGLQYNALSRLGKVTCLSPEVQALDLTESEPENYLPLLEQLSLKCVYIIELRLKYMFFLFAQHHKILIINSKLLFPLTAFFVKKYFRSYQYNLHCGKLRYYLKELALLHESKPWLPALASSQPVHP